MYAFLLLLLVAWGCGDQHATIERALEEAFADGLVGCFRIAWDPTPKERTHHRQRMSCGTDHRQRDRPYIFRALTRSGRVIARPGEKSTPNNPWDDQFELVAGYPVVNVKNRRGTMTAMCWGDARVRVVDVGQDRVWRWDRFYDVASAAGIDTLRIAQLRKPVLRLDIWYQMTIVPRPWAERLPAKDLALFRRNRFRRSWSNDSYLIPDDREHARIHKTEALYIKGDWYFSAYIPMTPDFAPERSVTVTTSRQRIVWPLHATQPVVD